MPTWVPRCSRTTTAAATKSRRTAESGSGGTSSGALLGEGATQECPPGSPSVGCNDYSFLFRDGVPYYRADGAPVFPVPEPAIWALVALGIVLLWLGRPRPKS